MKMLLSVILGSVALSLMGCTTVARWSGATYAIKGVVRDRDDGSPVANLRVRVTGMHWDIRYLFAPSAFIALTELVSDSSGRFSCTVPRYDAYRFYAGDMARTKWGGPILDREDISKSGEAVILVVPPLFGPQEPNKAPATVFRKQG